MKRLVILLICLSLLCPAVSLADDTFYFIFGMLSEEDILGEPDAAGPLDVESGGLCLLAVDFSDSTVMIFGEDEDGKTSAAIWNNVESDKMLAILIYYAGAFSETDDFGPTDFVISYKIGEDDEEEFIMSESEADTLYGILMNEESDSDDPRPDSRDSAESRTSTEAPAAAGAKNGEVFISPDYQGVCPFTVIADSDTDYYIYLEYQGAPDETTVTRAIKYKAASPYEPDVAFYLKAGQQVEINVPIGVYKLYYATGTEFYDTSRLFGETTRYYSSDDLLTFNADSMYYLGHTITLLPSYDGNFDTDPIPGDQFPAR